VSQYFKDTAFILFLNKKGLHISFQRPFCLSGKCRRQPLTSSISQGFWERTSSVFPAATDGSMN
jgi:hypothetical protein